MRPQIAALLLLSLCFIVSCSGDSKVEKATSSNVSAQGGSKPAPTPYSDPIKEYKYQERIRLERRINDGIRSRGGMDSGVDLSGEDYTVITFTNPNYTLEFCKKQIIEKQGDGLKGIGFTKIVCNNFQNHWTFNLNFQGQWVIAE
jgi:hypothetical protein